MDEKILKEYKYLKQVASDCAESLLFAQEATKEAQEHETWCERRLKQSNDLLEADKSKLDKELLLEIQRICQTHD